MLSITWGLWLSLFLSSVLSSIIEETFSFRGGRMSEKRPIKPKVYARAIVAIALITVWILSVFSGLILWLAPEVRRAGQQPLLFGITKHNWGEIHFWICVAVVVVTILHIIVDWKALRGVIRYMTSVHRDRITQI